MLGHWGCENIMLNIIKNSGYKILNPYLDIIIIHVHNDDTRGQEDNKREYKSIWRKTIVWDKDKLEDL